MSLVWNQHHPELCPWVSGTRKQFIYSLEYSMQHLWIKLYLLKKNKTKQKENTLELDSLTSPMEMTSFNCVSVLCPWFFSRVYVRNNHLDISSHQRHEYGRRFSVQSWGASVRISLVLVRGSSARYGVRRPAFKAQLRFLEALGAFAKLFILSFSFFACRTRL